MITLPVLLGTRLALALGTLLLSLAACCGCAGLLTAHTAAVAAGSSGVAAATAAAAAAATATPQLYGLGALLLLWARVVSGVVAVYRAGCGRVPVSAEVDAVLAPIGLGMSGLAALA